MQPAASIVVASREGPPITAHLYQAKDHHPLALAADAVALTVYENGTLKGSTGTMPLSTCQKLLLADEPWVPLNGGLSLDPTEARRLLQFIEGGLAQTWMLGPRGRLSSLAERVC